MLTDGVNNVGQIDPVSSAQFAKNKNIKVYTIGIGTTKGAPIPIYHPTYGKIYARYPNGQLVLTELDEDVLKEISTITNGRYFNATDTDELKKIYKEINELENNHRFSKADHRFRCFSVFISHNYWSISYSRRSYRIVFSWS